MGCEYMCDTRGSSFVSPADDVLEMSVMCWVSGVGGVCEIGMCMTLSRVGGVEGERIWFGLYQSCMNRRGVGCMFVIGLSCCGRGSRWMVQGLEGWGYVMPVCVVSLDYLWIWQVHVYVYCARHIPAHLRCTQCSVLLYLIDNCFITCICRWQIL